MRDIDSRAAWISIIGLILPQFWAASISWSVDGGVGPKTLTFRFSPFIWSHMRPTRPALSRPPQLKQTRFANQSRRVWMNEWMLPICIFEHTSNLSDDAKALKIENYTKSKKICKIEVLYILTGRKECGVKVYTSRTERLSCRVVLQVPPLKFTNTQCWSSRHLPKHLSVITVPLLLTKELNTLRGVTKKNTLCLEWCLGVQFMICCHIMSLILRSN